MIEHPYGEGRAVLKKITMEEVDVRLGKCERLLERALERFLQDPNVTERNKELVTRYVRDARLGKTVHNRARKKIGAARLSSNVGHFMTLLTFTTKNLDEVTQEDMESPRTQYVEHAAADPQKLGMYPKKPKGIKILGSNQTGGQKEEK